MQRRVAQLPLHGGKAPPYLFQRMTRLSGAMTMAVIEEYGPGEMLRRLADPWWFQAFACVLGFDWHSSGVTTVTCGALKEAQRVYGADLGLFVAGGKGATSRKAPAEIAAAADRSGITSGEKLVYASRMAAKVDSAALQDGYQIYHHTFFFTPKGEWCVVQQGMNELTSYARRYHWLADGLHDFVCEPHAGIQNLSTINAHQIDLNMVAAEASTSRDATAELVREGFPELSRFLEAADPEPMLLAPAHHPVLPGDVDLPRLKRIARVLHEKNPTDFETLLGTANVGPATVRSLALIAELIYDAPVSRRDPNTPRVAEPGSDPAAGSARSTTRRWADYSYAHGGKDGYPFPVDRPTYDRNINVLTDAVRKARLGQKDKCDALKRLAVACRE